LKIENVYVDGMMLADDFDAPMSSSGMILRELETGNGVLESVVLATVNAVDLVFVVEKRAAAAAEEILDCDSLCKSLFYWAMDSKVKSQSLC
jgi:hypothetical protein